LCLKLCTCYTQGKIDSSQQGRRALDHVSGCGRESSLRGTRNDGVYVSNDGGSHWSARNSGLPERSAVNYLAAIGTNLFANIGDGDWEWSGGYLYRSADYGGKWIKVPSERRFGALIATGEDLLAGSSDCSVFISKDVGLTWTRQRGFDHDPEILDVLPEQFVTCFAVAGPYIFAGIKYPGIGRSSDKGETFDWIELRLPKDSTLECLTTIGTSVFAGTSRGVYLSDDAGETWRQAASGLPAKTRVTCFAEHDEKLFAGTSRGVFRSIDGGVSWKATNSGLANTMVTSLAIIGTKIFAGTQGGVFASTNDGQAWKPSMKTFWAQARVSTFPSSDCGT